MKRHTILSSTTFNSPSTDDIVLDSPVSITEKTAPVSPIPGRQEVRKTPQATCNKTNFNIDGRDTHGPARHVPQNCQPPPSTPPDSKRISRLSALRALRASTSTLSTPPTSRPVSGVHCLWSGLPGLGTPVSGRLGVVSASVSVLRSDQRSRRPQLWIQPAVSCLSVTLIPGVCLSLSCHCSSLNTLVFDRRSRTSIPSTLGMAFGLWHWSSNLAVA